MTDADPAEGGGVSRGSRIRTLHFLGPCNQVTYY